MKYHASLLALLLLLVPCQHFVETQQLNLPQSLKLCPRASPNLANCIRDSIDHLRPYLKTGDLGNGFVIEGIDPFRQEDIYLERGRGLFFHLKNIKAYKLTNFKVEKLRVNLDKLDFEVLISCPYVETAGDYKMNMRLGILDIKGAGRFTSRLESPKIRLRLKGELYKDSNGVEYTRFVKSDVHVKIPTLVFNLENLFRDKVLNDVANDLINQNINLFLPDIEANVQNSFSRISIQTGNQIVRKIPFKVLFA